MRITERMLLQNLEQRVATYDSHRADEIEGENYKGNLVYLRGDVIKVLHRYNDQWGLGFLRNSFGIFPLEHTTSCPFVRALSSIAATNATEISFVKGDVLPAFPSDDPTRFTIYRGDDYGLVPSIHFTTTQALSQEERMRNTHHYYQYSPLRRGDIRLLCITLDNSREFLACGKETLFFDLIHVPANQAPNYTALSYCWGDPRERKAVFCNGKLLDIPINLWIALRWNYPSRPGIDGFLSPVFGGTYPGTALPAGTILDPSAFPGMPTGTGAIFWADAICINQTDIVEKNHQIPLMDSIYSRAALVQVYVNESDNSLATVLSMQMIEMGINDTPEWTVVPQATISTRFKRADWLTLQEFFTQQVFRRSWIIQEIVLGTSVQFRYGPTIMTFAQLCGFVTTMQCRIPNPAGSGRNMGADEAKDDKAFSEGIRQLYNLAEVRSLRSEGSSQGFIEILQRFRAAKATDPRDKVYSLLSLASQHYRNVVIPEYSLSNTATDVYRELAMCAVRTADVKGLLLNAGTSQAVAGLPSWVPDWSIEPRHIIDPEFYACTGLTGRVHAILPAADPNKLIVRGAVLDKITRTCPRWMPRKEIEFPDGPTDPPVVGTVPCCIQIVDHLTFAGQEALESCGRRYPNGDDLSEATWQTLVCGRGWGERRSNAADKTHYDAFLERYRDQLCNSNFNGRQMVATSDNDYIPLSDMSHRTRLEEDLSTFLTVMARFQDGRRTCITQNFYFGTVPDDAEDGDVIALLVGFSVPFVLRRVNGCAGGSADEYKLVGHCYVHGIMDGELIEAVEGNAEPSVKGATIVDINLV